MSHDHERNEQPREHRGGDDDLTDFPAGAPNTLTFQLSVPLCGIGPLAEALSSAWARLMQNDPRIAEILATVKRLITMSQSTQDTVDQVGLSVAELKAEVATDLGVVAARQAALEQKIADLIAAGSGATPAQLASLQTDAAEVRTVVKTMHDALNPDPVVIPPVIVFDANDPTPNSAGGRNSDQLPNFDPAQPLTA